MNPLNWQKRLRPLLTPVSLLYRRILAARRAKRESEGSPTFRSVCQCFSMGNIAWGGTGKIPVVDWLLGWSEAQGLRAVVLLQGYRAQPPESPLHISPSRTPGEAGDEPLMLALEHPSAAVMVDPDRRRPGRWAEERLSPDLFVLDDGLQHMEARRDLDVVLLRPDDLDSGWGRVIPAGAWREDPEALERADAFMIKYSPEAWKSLRPACERRLAEFRRPLFSFSLHPGSLRKTGTGECRDVDAFAGKPHALATGAGDPAQVWEAAAWSVGYEPAEYIVHPDHHAYTPEDAAELEGFGMSVICTSKDAVKLRELRLADAWTLWVEATFGPALWTEVILPHWLDAWVKRKGLF